MLIQCQEPTRNLDLYRSIERDAESLVYELLSDNLEKANTRDRDRIICKLFTWLIVKELERNPDDASDVLNWFDSKYINFEAITDE